MAEGGAVDERPYPANTDSSGNVIYPNQAGKGQQSPIGRANAVAQFAQSRDGQPYGGNEDCSGFISELANVAVGLAPSSGRMSTANEGQWLGALGFQIGGGSAGSFRVGWINDPKMAAGGHTAGTLPNNVNVESGGATSKVMYGGQAIGASNSLFNQHAYLIMDTTGTPGASPGITGGPGYSAPTTGVGTYSQINPQAPLPGRRSEEELQIESGKAAVDAANSERNAVYANPASTDQDKLAADIKYQHAQNALEQSQKSGDTSALSLQGFFSKAGSILATGLLSAFGLENSIFSETNVYNRAFNQLNDHFNKQNNLGGGYSYTPQNLPSLATTVTPQNSAPTIDPALKDQVPGAQTGQAPGAQTQIPQSGPVTGALAVDPNLGSTSINVYSGGAGTSSGGVSATPGGPAAIVAAVKGAMADVGWDKGAQWDAVDQLVGHESSWNPQASAWPASDAYGLFQFLSSTWATVGGSKTDDPGLQGLYGKRYIAQRYGTPTAAWAFWQSHNPHWYDDGGIADGVGMLFKNVIKPERILNPRQTETFDSAIPLLESINAAGWSPNRVDASTLGAARQAYVTRGGHDFSTTIVSPRVADVGDLVELAERKAAAKAIGLMAAMI